MDSQHLLFIIDYRVDCDIFNALMYLWLVGLNTQLNVYLVSTVMVYTLCDLCDFLYVLRSNNVTEVFFNRIISFCVYVFISYLILCDLISISYFILNLTKIRFFFTYIQKAPPLHNTLSLIVNNIITFNDFAWLHTDTNNNFIFKNLG